MKSIILICFTFLTLSAASIEERILEIESNHTALLNGVRVLPDNFKEIAEASGEHKYLARYWIYSCLRKDIDGDNLDFLRVACARVIVHTLIMMEFIKQPPFGLGVTINKDRVRSLQELHSKFNYLFHDIQPINSPFYASLDIPVEEKK